MARQAADPPLTAAHLIAATARLIGTNATTDDRFGIAVSGGPDSMALLALAADAFPGRIAAATVDHGLRSGSADEAKMVADYCAACGIDHVTLQPTTPITGSVQAAARTARYALLDQWRTRIGLDWLMTAHHADDQLETLVMRLNRASGLAGLSGIRERQGNVLRPLLALRRSALQIVVTDRQLPHVDDPSNSDPRFDRARIRRALGGHDLLDAAAVAASARHLAQDEQALDWAVAQLADQRIVVNGSSSRIDMAGLPRGLRRRLLIVALVRVGEPHPRGDALDRVLDDMADGHPAMLGNSLIARDGATWSLQPARPRRTIVEDSSDKAGCCGTATE